MPRNIWMDHFTSELEVTDLLDVIDDTKAPPPLVTADQFERRNNHVRDIIIQHIDKKYHAKIIRYQRQ